MQIEIGKIVNTHGLKGECKIFSNTDFLEERFAVGNVLHLKYGKEELALEVASFRVHKGCALVSFVNKQDINLIEMYKGCSLFINEDELHELEDNEAYFYQLIDCVVIDEQKNHIGVVSDVLETAAHDILRIKRENDKDVLVPYVDRFIIDADLDKKVIVVSLIEGMI